MDVKPYSFSDLESQVKPSKTQGFSFQEFSVTNDNSKIIRQEREHALKNEFKIDEIVKRYRGLTAQEQQDLEDQIRTEVEKRLVQVKKEAYEEGIKLGAKEGRGQVINQAEEAAAQDLDNLRQMVESFHVQYTSLLESNKHHMFELMKRLSKWLVLKEVKENDYLYKLLEKLIFEMSERQNLTIKINPNNFKELPQIIKKLEEKVGPLHNVRLESDLDLDLPGIIVESEQGLLDGSTETLLQSIDNFFKETEAV